MKLFIKCRQLSARPTILGRLQLHCNIAEHSALETAADVSATDDDDDDDMRDNVMSHFSITVH